MVITDEIFSHVTYDKPHKSISTVPGMAERSLVIDTFSKTYAMTGWRIGFAVAPVPVIDKLSIFLQDSITNVAAFIQKAAYVAQLLVHRTGFMKSMQCLNKRETEWSQV